MEKAELVKKYRNHIIDSIGKEFINANDMLKVERQAEKYAEAEMRKRRAFEKWLDTFIEEKGIEAEEMFSLDISESWNLVQVGVVIEYIKNLPVENQEQTKEMLVKIDFQNGDVRHFLKYIAKGIVTGQI